MLTRGRDNSGEAYCSSIGFEMWLFYAPFLALLCLHCFVAVSTHRTLSDAKIKNKQFFFPGLFPFGSGML